LEALSSPGYGFLGLRKVQSIVGAPTYPVFISQYLSQSIRDFCEENDIGYFDFRGNCLLEFDVLVKDKLWGDGYAAWRGEAFVVTQPERLLEQWSKQYKNQDHTRLECYGEGSAEEIEQRFAALCRQQSIDYA